MFWNIQTMSEAVRSAEKHLGAVGRYVSLKDPQFSGVGLYTESAGKFWYGDINLPNEEAKLKLIAKDLKETVYVLPEWDTDSTRTLKQQSLWIIDSND